MATVLNWHRICRHSVRPLSWRNVDVPHMLEYHKNRYHLMIGVRVRDAREVQNIRLHRRDIPVGIVDLLGVPSGYQII